MTQTIEELERQLTEMTQEDDDLSEGVKAFQAPLLQQREQLIAQRTEVKEVADKALAVINERIAAREKLLRGTGWAEKPTKKRKADGGEPKPSPESVTKLVRWLDAQPEPLDFNDVANGVGISISSANKQIAVARSLELVRIAKMGGTTGRKQFFGTFPDAIKRLDEGSVLWP